LGRFIGKALLDGRQLDMPFAEQFFKWLQGQRLTSQDLKIINPVLHRSLSSLIELCKSKQSIENDATLVRTALFWLKKPW
jgi:hypothetical protein